MLIAGGNRLPRRDNRASTPPTTGAPRRRGLAHTAPTRQDLTCRVQGDPAPHLSEGGTPCTSSSPSGGSSSYCVGRGTLGRKAPCSSGEPRSSPSPAPTTC